MVKTTAMSPINHTSQSPNRNGFAQHTTSQPTSEAVPLAAQTEVVSW